MIFNALKYTLELLLRYGIFNAGDILLIERCYSPQETSLSRCFECSRNPLKFCMYLKQVMSMEICCGVGSRPSKTRLRNSTHRGEFAAKHFVYRVLMGNTFRQYCISNTNKLNKQTHTLLLIICFGTEQSKTGTKIAFLTS